MAHVSGPTSRLPGSLFTALLGQMCDEHDDRQSVRRVQGETDSFGAEYIDMCQECFDAYRNRDTTEERTGMCDWCKQSATDLRSRRDYDEGMSGPVYRVCGACVKRENDRLDAELVDLDFD